MKHKTKKLLQKGGLDMSEISNKVNQFILATGINNKDGTINITHFDIKIIIIFLSIHIDELQPILDTSLFHYILYDNYDNIRNKIYTDAIEYISNVLNGKILLIDKNTNKTFNDYLESKSTLLKILFDDKDEIARNIFKYLSIENLKTIFKSKLKTQKTFKNYVNNTLSYLGSFLHLYTFKTPIFIIF